MPANLLATADPLLIAARPREGRSGRPNAWSQWLKQDSFGGGHSVTIERDIDFYLRAVSMDRPALKSSFIGHLALLIGFSTALYAQVTKPAPATQMDEKKAELGGVPWDPRWDRIIEKALPPEMLSRQVPKDVRRFCPRFYEMDDTDKRTFWAYFFQALSAAEASLNPDATVRHANPEGTKTDQVSGRAPRTEGLLQLAYEDKYRYGCDFNWKADRKLKPDDPAKTILQPKNNLECGVKILDHQIIDQHKPLLTRSGYWAPLRPGRPRYHVFIEQMSNPPSACGISTETTINKSATTKSVQESVDRDDPPK